MANKADLEKEIKSLKQTIRELKSQVKVGKEVAEGLNDVGYGVFLGEDRNFQIVKLLFDFEKKTAAVDEVVRTTKSVGDAAVRIRNLVVDEVIEVDKERNK